MAETSCKRRHTPFSRRCAGEGGRENGSREERPPKAFCNIFSTLSSSDTRRGGEKEKYLLLWQAKKKERCWRSASTQIRFSL